MLQVNGKDASERTQPLLSILVAKHLVSENIIVETANDCTTNTHTCVVSMPQGQGFVS